MTATVAGVERAHTFERADAILPAACLDDWLADRPPDYEKGEITILGRGVVRAQDRRR